MKPHTAADAAMPAVLTATRIEGPAAPTAGREIRLESCAELDCIVVRTRKTEYQIIVLSGETAEVMVRGGRFFPEFRRAMIAGSIFGSSAVKLRSIAVGLHLELHVDGQSFVTSRIQSVSQCRGGPAVERLPLFVAERQDRIDAAGAASRNEAGSSRY